MRERIEGGASLSRFFYCLNKAYDELEIAIENANDNLNSKLIILEVEFRLGNFLHALINYWERLEKTEDVIICPADKKLLSAFKHATNRLKHEPMLVKLHKLEGGFTFPVVFPLIIPPITFHWSIDNIPIKRFEKQLENYKNLLQEKEIMVSVKNVMGVVEKYPYC